MRLLLADDHFAYRRGLELMFSELEPDTSPVHCGSRKELETCLSNGGEGAFDLIVLDLKMPGFFGLESLHFVKKAAPEVPVLVVSGEDHPDVAKACVQGGAFAYISKSATPALQTETLERVIRSLPYSRGVGSSLPLLAVNGEQDSIGQVGSSDAEKLTPRQKSVMRLAARGMTNKMIARELGISDGTVKTHLTNLMDMFAAHTRTQLVFEMARRGVVLDDQTAAD